MAKRIENPFETLRQQLEASGGINMATKRAIGWFKGKVSQMYNESDRLPFKPIAEELKKERKLSGRMAVGSMFTFRYLPKTRDKLPYYDTFPLILVTKYSKRRVWGCNLHYYHPKWRAFLMTRFLSLINNHNFDNTTRLDDLTYEVLSGHSRYGAFRPTFHSYNLNRIRSKILYVEPQDWYTAMFLPIDSFKKKTKSYVWKDSVQVLRYGKKPS